MKIIRLKVQYVKGVRQIEIIEPGDVVEIAGQNGAGKSSVLDSIIFALGGAKAIDRKPLRDGEEKGEILLETEELEIVRKFREDGATTLTVRGRDGAKYGQRRLDEIFSAFTFDPLAFSRMRVDEQLSTMQALAGADYCAKLDEMDREYGELYEQRTSLNRDLSRMGNIPEVPAAEEVDISALAAELDAVNKYNLEQQNKAQAIEGLRQDALRVQREIDRLKGELAHQEALAATLAEQINASDKPEPPRPSDEINAKILTAGEQNRRAQERREYLRKIDAHRTLAQQINEITAKLDKIKEEREAFSKKAQLPIDGVQFGSSGIRVNGIPFEQLASSEKIRVSARIGMSLNPELRIMFVRDGSLLDQNSYYELCAVAKERDYQIWMETVGSGHGDAIILEAGEVKHMPAPAPTPQPEASAF